MFHLFLLIISILTSNGYPSPSEHSSEINIVGGKQVIIEDYPYMLSLLNSEGLYCGRCIISNLYALTAGHCVTFASEDLIIHSGSTFWNKNGSYHHILYNIIMGSFKNKDLAILRVKEPFIFDATRQPIPIFSNGEVAQAGTMATVLGWGDIKPNDISEQLRAAEIPIIDRERCRFIYINISIGEIVDGEICAGYLDRGGKDSCQGDSGGPLVIDGRLAGIISMGNGCARPNAPGIYTDIGYYNKWINKHINS